MGLGGTILGSVIGGFLGGPVGAIIGAGIGAYASRDKNAAEKMASGRHAGATAVEQDAHLIALFRSLGKMAKADGIVSQDEADFAKGVLQDLQLPPDQRARMIAAFSEGKNTAVPFRNLVRDVAAAFLPEAYSNIMRVYCMMALASGAVSPEEQTLLLEAEQCFGLTGYSARFFRTAGGNSRSYSDSGSSGNSRSDSYSSSRSSSAELDEAYTVLDIPVSATDAEVKKAWRKKAMEFHPDKIQGKGLPEAFIKFATEETRRINAAYDTIRKARGF